MFNHDPSTYTLIKMMEHSSTHTLTAQDVDVHCGDAIV
jgi:hypothetical protein